MNTTSLNVRLSAAAATLAIVVSILSGIGALANAPADSSLLAQARPVVVAMR